tara:strand:+ start:19473 stop:19853 length:381 start_codon:yes stop_codon:yes gene_type:complete
MIKNIPIEDLRDETLQILRNTYIELGQSPEDLTILSMSYSLADDLNRDFNKMEMRDIWEAFRIGVRQTEVFHITVKSYYKWIKDHQQIIWNNETVEEYRKDKRLQYRSRKGTGMKRLNINSIKQIG